MTPDAEPAKATATTVPPATPTPRRFAIDALHVFVLTAFVVAQNCYDRLARQNEYLVDPEVTFPAIWGVIASLSLVLPLLIVGIEWLAGLIHRKLREAIHLCVVLLCSTLLMSEVLQLLEFLPGAFVIAGAFAGASALTVGYDRFANLRSIVTLASPAILLFPALLIAKTHAAPSSIAHRAIHDTSRDPVPVVLVVFDEFCGGSLMTPQREIDTVRFPNFAALQQQSTWYRGAASVSPMTNRAVPAILTGNFTEVAFTQSPTNVPQNLFSLLSSAGKYDLVAFEPLTSLSPRRIEQHHPGITEVLGQTAGMLKVLGFVYLYEICPRDFHDHLPLIPRVWFGFHDSKRIDRNARRGAFRYGWTDRRDEQVTHFLSCIDSTPRSMLYFAHLLIPHAPWCYFPSGTRYARDMNNLDRLCLESDDSVISDELGVIQNQQRNLLQVMYVDNVVGQLTARLKEEGIWDRCLLIVTADHGVSFRMGQDRREYSGRNTEDLLSIPLFIKYPGQIKGEVSDLPVQSIDLLPTILDQIGIKPIAPMEGSPIHDPQVALRKKLFVRDPRNNLAFDPKVLHDSPVPKSIHQRFGDGTDRWNLFRIGPHSEWLGQPLTSLKVGAESAIKLECLLQIPPVGSTGVEQLPYHIEGYVITPGIQKAPVELVTVVDGIVCGTTRTYRQFGYTDRWSVMLPEWSYPSETSRAEFFTVSSDGSLHHCPVNWIEPGGNVDSGK